MIEGEFQIPANIVDEVKWRMTQVFSVGEDYIKQMINVMGQSTSCKILAEKLEKDSKKASSPTVYLHGAALGFDATFSTAQHLGINFEITLSSLNLHHVSVMDYTDRQEESDINWPENAFLERLKDSGEFMDWYQTMSDVYKRHPFSRLSFRRGVYDAAMPIIAVIDTQDLNTKWGQEIDWNKPSLDPTRL